MDTWLLFVAVLSFAARNSFAFLATTARPLLPTTQYGLASGLLFAALSDDAALQHFSRPVEVLWIVARLCFAPTALVIAPHFIRAMRLPELFWVSNLLGLIFAGASALVTTYAATRHGPDAAVGAACAGIAMAACVDIATTHRAVDGFSAGMVRATQ